MKGFVYHYTHYMRMKKKPLNLLINEDLVKRAREQGINLSAFLEIKLQEHLALIEGKSVNFKKQEKGKNSKKKGSMDWMGFEPTASTLRRLRSSTDLPALKKE